MATTQTLEENYWHGRREDENETAAGIVVRRKFLVPRASYTTLEPTPVTDTAYDDSDLAVVGVTEGPAVSATLQWMLVDYQDRNAGASPI